MPSLIEPFIDLSLLYEIQEFIARSLWIKVFNV